MREARYGVGSVLVEEGDDPTTVFVVVEGECRIVKGKPRSQSGSKKGIVGGLLVWLRDFGVGLRRVWFQIVVFFFFLSFFPKIGNRKSEIEKKTKIRKKLKIVTFFVVRDYMQSQPSDKTK